MPYAFLLALAVILPACGDASDVVVLEDETGALTTEVAAPVAPDTTDYYRDVGDETIDPSAEPSPFRSTGRCREVAEELTSGEYEVMQSVPGHTFSFRTYRDAGACFIPLFRDVTAAQLAPGEPFPYPYSFVIDENGEARDLEVEQAPTASALEAVGFEDINGDGVDDIFIVHDGDAASLAFVSDLEGRPAQVWRQMVVDNGEAGVFVETVAELKDFWRENLGS
ncbi:hypothetical protein [Rubrivirga sp.]|uniref:hypothetical protein n=1 Tax=Rubrivirga sp. TaxID=1885344 RepID=UPI003C71DA94